MTGPGPTPPNVFKPSAATARRVLLLRIGAGILTLAVVAGALIWRHNSANSLEARAQREARAAVLKCLKAPDTAKFGPVNPFDKSGSEIIVCGTVTAHNSFGVPLTGPYEVLLIDDGPNGLRIEAVSLDGKMAFESDERIRRGIVREVAKLDAQEKKQQKTKRDREDAEIQAALQKKADAVARRAARDAKAGEAEARKAQDKLDWERQRRAEQELAAKTKAERRETERDAIAVRKEAGLKQVQNRRAAGKWKSAATFSYEKVKTAAEQHVRLEAPGARLRYEFSTPAVVRVFDQDHVPVGEELKLARGKGTQLVEQAPAGSVFISIRTGGRWWLVVEE